MIEQIVLLSKRTDISLADSYDSPAKGQYLPCPSCHSSNIGFGYQPDQYLPAIYTCYSCLSAYKIIFFSPKEENSLMSTDGKQWIWHKVSTEQIPDIELYSKTPMNDSCPFCKSTSQVLVRVQNLNYICRLCQSCNTIYYGEYESERNIVAMEVAQVIKEERNKRGEEAGNYLDTNTMIQYLSLVFSKDNPDWDEEKFKKECGIYTSKIFCGVDIYLF